MKDIAAFLEKSLPVKIKNEVFYETIRWEHKGKMCERKQRLKPIYIVQNLRKQEFIIGITDNPEKLAFPEDYILLWTKMKKFIDCYDTLTVEQEKYALISINKACKMLEITRPSLYKIINERKIPYVEVLSQKRIQLKDLLNYIDDNKKYK